MRSFSPVVVILFPLLTHSWTISHEGPTRSRLDLFFRGSASETTRKYYRGEERILERLSENDVSLPYRINDSSIVLRLMEEDDIAPICKLCLDEYSSSQFDFPQLQELHDKDKVIDWYDTWALKQLIDISLSLKLMNQKKDHAVVVACRSIDNELVGMVEVSRQIIDPARNPSPFPYPLMFKRVISMVSRTEMGGWIANLLVDPSERGRGLGKLLVAATEGIAREWSCESIHLHCDADTVAGRVSQSLYGSLGYLPLGSLESKRWPSDKTDSIFDVEGVPLLYLQKQLR